MNSTPDFRNSASPDLTTTVVKRGRDRWTNAQLAQLDEQIVNILALEAPQSIRHMFYRMTDPRLPVSVPKTDKGSPNGYTKVQRRISKLRESGVIGYGDIVDATRMGYHVPSYSSAGDFLRQMQHAYRGDLWREAGVYVEVWVESRSIAAVIRGLCEELRVSLYPSGGFSSWTLAHDAAENLAGEIEQEDRPAHILYIGDYDPAGVLIDQSIEREIRKHLDPHVDLTFHRLGINPDQIAKHNLPTKPRKVGDRRARHIKETVEAEAMPAGVLRDLLRSKIESFLPEGNLEALKAVEREERRGLKLIANCIQSDVDVASILIDHVDDPQYDRSVR